MAIKYHKHINCEWCSAEIEVGKYAYIHNSSAICEECMDQALQDIKDGAAVRVDNNNFDLEEEI